MKSGEILHEIWSALESKQNEADSGLAQPNDLLASVHKELSKLGHNIRYAEYILSLPEQETRSLITSFFSAAHKAASLNAKDAKEMHQNTRNILHELGLQKILLKMKKFFPERTRILYQILVALDQKIESYRFGVMTISPFLISYFENLSEMYSLLLDPTQHHLIEDKELEAKVDDFFEALSETAKQGKKGGLLYLNATKILSQLELSDLSVLLKKYIPERDNSGAFILVPDPIVCS